MDTEVRYLQRPEGRIAYTSQGTGPLVITSPGMGDLRHTWRFLSPRIAEAGFQVVDADLRGHGDSDTTFSAYGDAETGRDIIALLEELGQPAFVVGNSMGAAAAVWAAAARPDLVRGLVLVGPVVRDARMPAILKLLMRAALTPPLTRLTWNAYLPSLYAGQRPADFDDYRRAVSDALKRPGYARAFAKTAQLSHAVAEQSLPRVQQPILIIMGEKDPDFPDPAAEAAWLATGRNADVLMVPDAAHYPQSQRPDIVVPAIVSYLKGLAANA